MEYNFLQENYMKPIFPSVQTMKQAAFRSGFTTNDIVVFIKNIYEKAKHMYCKEYNLNAFKLSCHAASSGEKL